MKTMTESEWRSFLSFGTRTAKLATRRPDGRPHVAPIWFVLDGNDLVFTTHNDSVKGKNLRHDPRMMLAVDDEQPPFAFVLVEGSAILSNVSPPELLPWTTRIAVRYTGVDQADAYGKRNAGEGELLVRVPLSKVITQKGVAEWQRSLRANRSAREKKNVLGIFQDLGETHMITHNDAKARSLTQQAGRLRVLVAGLCDLCLLAGRVSGYFFPTSDSNEGRNSHAKVSQQI